MINETAFEPHSREERLNSRIADYLDREDAGQPPPRTAWLEEHPEFADDLRQFLDEHQRLERLGSPLRALAEPGVHNALTVGLSATDTTETRVVVRDFGDYELLAEIARGGM